MISASAKEGITIEGTTTELMAELTVLLRQLIRIGALSMDEISLCLKSVTIPDYVVKNMSPKEFAKILLEEI